MKQYKIFPQQDDEWIGGQFDPKILEQKLNAYAAEGWRVATCTAGQFFVGSFRNEIIVILEKDA